MRKQIDGYSRYEIDETGRVFNILTGKELHPNKDGTGYVSIELVGDNGKSKRLLLHRLVAKAFIPNEKGLPIINHKDENPENNHFSNLEWCTYKYNINYGTCQERIRKSKQKFYASEALKELARKNGRAASKAVVQMLKSGEIIKSYDSAKEAATQTGANHSHILEVCKGTRKSAGGYAWAYRGEC